MPVTVCGGGNWIDNVDFKKGLIDEKQQILLYVNRCNDNNTLGGSFDPKIDMRILLLVEPISILPKMYTYATKEHRKFDCVITYHADLLKKIPNGLKCVLPVTWIPKAICQSYMDATQRDTLIKAKKDQATTVVGGKMMAPGHKLRHEFLQVHQNRQFPSHMKLFTSNTNMRRVPNCLPLGLSKYPLFEDSKYSVVIENCAIPNYFTEKLIEAFVTCAIPVYWGCTNIGEYFDVEGMVIVTNLGAKDIYERMEHVVAQKGEYERRLPAILNNLHRAQQYMSYYDRLWTVIKQACRDKMAKAMPTVSHDTSAPSAVTSSSITAEASETSHA